MLYSKWQTLKVSFSGTYSLDQMSDDEDLEPVRPRQSASGGQITSSQMAAALAAISGSQSPVSNGQLGVSFSVVVKFVVFDYCVGSSNSIQNTTDLTS